MTIQPVAYKYFKVDPNTWNNTGLTINSGDVVRIKPISGRVNIWPSGHTWANPDGAQDGSGFQNVPALPAALIGRIGLSGTAFKVGRYFQAPINQTGTLYLTANDDHQGDNRGYFRVSIIVNPPGVPTHNAKRCELGNDPKAQSPNPIELYDGNKVFSASDLSVQTPAGALAFERSYNQSRRADANYQFMGLGWSHNHAYKLVISGTLAQVFMSEGGALTLDDPGLIGHFVARPGSNAVLDFATPNYVLTGQDKRQLTFEPSGVSGTYRLKKIVWVNNDTWTYTYTATPGKLSQIDDGYGRSLKFSYVNAPGQYNDGQLWRVGDQTASGLDTGSPTGRYVEFGYTPEKNNGVTITSPKALLASVRDLRANIWTYDYYGQNSGESTVAQLNFMTKRKSPALNGSPITLEDLTYTLSGSTITAIDQKRGNALLDTLFTFQANGQNQTTEVVAGKTITHDFANGVYLGASTGDAEDDLVNIQILNENYRPMGQLDGKGNETKLTWSSDGKLLNGVTDAKGNQTTFNYNASGVSADTLNYSLDAQNRKTQYVYGDSANPRLPTEVKVIDTDGVTVLRWQRFTYDSHGRTLTEQVLDPANGTTLLQRVTRVYYTTGNGNGLLQTVTQEDLVNPANNMTTTYFYDTAGRVVQTNQTAMFGSCTSAYTVYDAAGSVMASICNYDPGVGPAPTTAAEAAALFNASFPDKNRVTTYEYDALGRRTKVTSDAGASYALVTLTVYDALDRVIRTVASYDAATSGVGDPTTANHDAFGHGTDNTRNLVTDTAYNQRGQVRSQTDVLGNVILSGYDDAGRLVKTVQNASLPTYNNDYTGVSPDPSLAAYGPVSAAPDKDQISTTTYDSVGNVIKTVDTLGNVNYTAYDELNRPIKTVRNAKDAAVIGIYDNDGAYMAANDPFSASYTADPAADRDLTDLTEYDTLGRVKRTQDNQGLWTLYGYDPLGRQVKVIRSASNPNYNMVADPALASYSPSGTADLDLITTTTYDNQGRVLYTTDVQGQRTWSAYDGLNRVVKTIVNAVGTATDGGVNDPRSASYVPSPDSDKDQISVTTYDVNGRVQWTQDPRGNKTWYVYDGVGRQKKVIQNCTYVSGTPAPEDDTYVGNSAADRDIISRTSFDAQGRVASTFDPAGNETRFTYDVLGRRIKTVVNYVTGTFNASFPDQDLVSTTVYDVAGRVVSTTDVRGTPTALTYDAAGRRLTITQAAGTALATTNYTCYDKAGRVLRTIANHVTVPGDPAPDAQDVNGLWLFFPATHGLHEDTNLITTYTLDRLGRQTIVADPLRILTTRTYYKNSPAWFLTDPELAITQYRFDRVGRLTTVVAGWQDNGEDPGLWTWNAVNARWEKSNGTPIVHGTNNDTNIIVRTVYDKPGRLTSQRDPRGNLTQYTYDLLSRRTSLTDPLNHAWTTAYSNLSGAQAGQTRVTLTDPMPYQTQQDFDRAGRLATLQYLVESPKNTPDVTFSYDKLGNRTNMDETATGGASFVRKTTFAYDKARRLASAGFDTDGNGTIDQTVSYQYDAGGLRTRLTLPGSLNVTYTYDARGQLISLTDWASQATGYAYDNAGRLIAAARANGLLSQYAYDADGQLKQLRHSKGKKVYGHYAYSMDKRGNRTQVLEAVPQATIGATTLLYSDPNVWTYQGNWTPSNPYQSTSDKTAAVKLAFFGDQATLIMGQGPDHSIYDIYIDTTLWKSIDGYAAAAGDKTISIALDNEGPHVLDIRNRTDKATNSTGYLLRFKSLATPAGAPRYDLRTLKYTYDALARLLNASTYPGINTAAVASRQDTYAFDRAGNRTSKSDPNGSITYTYDAANRLVSDSIGNPYAYDNAGRLTSFTGNPMTWDRAGRLLSNGVLQYSYNGLGQRVRKVSGTITDYLLDVQPGLWQFLSATTGANTEYYVHGPLGLHAQQQTVGVWQWPLPDALGTIRAVADNATNLQEARHYTPYGELVSNTGVVGTFYGFTGQYTDVFNDPMIYLRARFYNGRSGSFLSLDPVEGDINNPISINRYMYVQGNVVNAVDPSGLIHEQPEQWNSCANSYPFASKIIQNYDLTTHYQQARCDCWETYIHYKHDYAGYNYCLTHGCPGTQAGPTPTAQPPVTIFFGGSWGDDKNHQGTQGSAHEKGPDPTSPIQTKVWFDNIPGMIPIQYPGDANGLVGKASHAFQAKSFPQFANSNLRVIGYSAGADSALIYADDYVTNNQGTGKISSLALLGPTATGTMLDGRTLHDPKTSLPDLTVLKVVLDNLLNHGVNVYWLDDTAAGGYEAKSYRKPVGVTAKFCFDDRSNRQEHWQTGNQGTGTNNSATYVQQVLTWLNNPWNC